MRKGSQTPEPRGRGWPIGEPALLRAIIDRGVAPATAIESWVGPLDGIQDFEIGAGPWRSRPRCRWRDFSRPDRLARAARRLHAPTPLVAGGAFGNRRADRTLPEIVEAMRHDDPG